MNPDIMKIKKTWTAKRSIIVAILSVAIGAAIFFISYMGASKDLGIGSFNESILQFMLSLRQPNMTNAMSTVTAFGSTPVMAAIVTVIVIIWASYKREFWRPMLLACSVIVASIVSTLIKSESMINRPAATSMVPPIELNFAFPSGHTLGIVVLLLVMGYLICSRRSSVVSTIIWISTTIIGTALISISRLYLGYHWLTDVIAAVGLGLAMLGIIIFIDKFITNKFTRLQ